MKLGVHRLPMRRQPHPADLIDIFDFLRLVRQSDPDVLHGHGAKAGAFVRLSPVRRGAIRVYTPHGGSLHYSPDTLKGKIYARMEWALMPRTDLFLFESQFARDTYQRVIGTPKGTVRCVFNGVTANEFDPVQRAADASDLGYVGEFRHIKGADILIDALAQLHRDGSKLTLTLAGDGEEMAKLRAQVKALGLEAAIRFIGHVPARQGFARGKLLVVPSRGDSMPYVVIEAAAAGIPMIAARVGGIPEVLGSGSTGLYAPGDPAALAAAIKAALAAPEAVEERTRALRERVFLHFSQKAMVEGVLDGYRSVLGMRS
jgi:glycosyltransferase involved in cell wall biosynthesis